MGRTKQTQRLSTGGKAPRKVFRGPGRGKKKAKKAREETESEVEDEVDEPVAVDTAKDSEEQRTLLFGERQPNDDAAAADGNDRKWKGKGAAGAAPAGYAGMRIDIGSRLGQYKYTADHNPRFTKADLKNAETADAQAEILFGHDPRSDINYELRLPQSYTRSDVQAQHTERFGDALQGMHFCSLCGFFATEAEMASCSNAACQRIYCTNCITALNDAVSSVGPFCHSKSEKQLRFRAQGPKGIDPEAGDPWQCYGCKGVLPYTAMAGPAPQVLAGFRSDLGYERNAELDLADSNEVVECFVAASTPGAGFYDWNCLNVTLVPSFEAVGRANAGFVVSQVIPAGSVLVTVEGARLLKPGTLQHAVNTNNQWIEQLSGPLLSTGGWLPFSIAVDARALHKELLPYHVADQREAWMMIDHLHKKQDRVSLKDPELLEDVKDLAARFPHMLVLHDRRNPNIGVGVETVLLKRLRSDVQPGRGGSSSASDVVYVPHTRKFYFALRDMRPGDILRRDYSDDFSPATKTSLFASKCGAWYQRCAIFEDAHIELKGEPDGSFKPHPGRHLTHELLTSTRTELHDAVRMPLATADAFVRRMEHLTEAKLALVRMRHEQMDGKDQPNAVTKAGLECLKAQLGNSLYEEYLVSRDSLNGLQCLLPDMQDHLVDVSVPDKRKRKRRAPIAMQLVYSTKNTRKYLR